MVKSKRTIFKLLICVLALLALATVLAACNIGYKPDRYDYLVTFEYNVGEGEHALSGSTKTQQIGVFANSLVIIRPGYNADFKEGIVDGYYLEGWYLPAHVDENGKPTRDENGFVILGRQWDFKSMRVNENITLYGNFEEKLSIRFINREDGKYIEHTVDYAPYSFVTEPADDEIPVLKDYTFLGKYYKSDGTKFEWDFEIGEEDIDVYVDFIPGTWRLVSTEEQFNTAIGANRNIYLQNDLNFEGKTLWDFSDYTGIVNGNGHKISNVTRDIVASKTYSDSRISCFGGIFGSLSGDAHIYNIKFENVNVGFDVNLSYLLMDVYIGLLAGRTSEKVKLENVSISGKLTYKENSKKTIYVGVIGESKGVIKEDCDFRNAEIATA